MRNRLLTAALITSLLLSGYGASQAPAPNPMPPAAEEPNRMLPYLNATTISAGAVHSLVIMADGSLEAFGANGRGQRGDDTLKFEGRPVASSTGLAAVEAGDLHSMALLKDGRLFAFGGNDDGQLGNGTSNYGSNPRAVEVMSGVASVSAGRRHSLVVTTANRLFAFGGNTYGQLGDGTSANRHLPVEVMRGVAAASAGAFHSLVLTVDGRVFAFGSNNSGQIGNDGGNPQRGFNRPVEVMKNAKAISAGGMHSLVLMNDGSVYAFGWNRHGQLGVNLRGEQVNKPVKILDGIAAISAGDADSYVITNDGRLLAFGQSYKGVFDASVNALVPDELMTGVVAVSAGVSHALIVTANGHLYSVGDNEYAQLGIPTTQGYSKDRPILIREGVYLPERTPGE